MKKTNRRCMWISHCWVNKKSTLIYCRRTLSLSFFWYFESARSSEREILFPKRLLNIPREDIGYDVFRIEHYLCDLSQAYTGRNIHSRRVPTHEYFFQNVNRFWCIDKWREKLGLFIKYNISKDKRDAFLQKNFLEFFPYMYTLAECEKRIAELS